MNISEEEMQNRRMKLWKEVGPFYLDFYESLQLPYYVKDIHWSKSLLNSNDSEANTLQLAFSAQLDQTSFLSVAGLLYPKEDAETFSPEELLNFDCNLKSLLLSQSNIRHN